MREIWKAVVGYEGLYEVSSLGRVRSLDRQVRCRGFRTSPGKTLTSWNSKGYLLVKLCGRGKPRATPVHLLVLTAFRGRRPPGKQAAHEDGNALNNAARNLSWKTQRANHDDKRRHGTVLRGADHPMAKLTTPGVLTARRLLRAGHTQKYVSEQLYVSPSTIGRIALRKTWAHV